MKNIFEQALPNTSTLLSAAINDLDIQNLSALFNTAKYDFLRDATMSSRQKICAMLAVMDDSALNSYTGFVTWVSQETRQAFTGGQDELIRSVFTKLTELKASFQKEATKAIDSEGETAKDFFSSTIDGWKQRLFGWASSTTTSAEGLYNKAKMVNNPVSYIQKRIDDLRSDTSFFGVIKTLLLKVAKFFAEILFPPTTPPAPAVGERRGPIDSGSFRASAAPAAPAAHASAAPAPAPAATPAVPAADPAAASSGGLFSRAKSAISTILRNFSWGGDSLTSDLTQGNSQPLGRGGN
ncbi:hypothetical protein N9C31_03105 [Gammaproteobacteria bacterium]|nr:hypothetical protein [Gammaproteobacteria bacterium]